MSGVKGRSGYGTFDGREREREVGWVREVEGSQGGLVMFEGCGVEGV